MTVPMTFSDLKRRDARCQTFALITLVWLWPGQNQHGNIGKENKVSTIALFVCTVARYALLTQLLSKIISYLFSYNHRWPASIGVTSLATCCSRIFVLLCSLQINLSRVELMVCLMWDWRLNVNGIDGDWKAIGIEEVKVWIARKVVSV